MYKHPNFTIDGKKKNYSGYVAQILFAPAHSFQKSGENNKESENDIQIKW